MEPTPSGADAPHAAVLKEADLLQAETARYIGGATSTYIVELFHFQDATGAFSAFTFYRDPAMRPESVGDNAAAGPGVFLAQKGTALLRVTATGQATDSQQVQTAAAALVQALPVANGPEAVLPTLPSLLPPDGLQKQTVHYAIGPAAYSGPLPAGAIDFSRDGEAATANYRLHGGEPGTLTLLIFPTPQIAGAVLRTITALPDASLHVATLRSGPLVGVVSGPNLPQADANRLLNQIHYVADITLNQPQGYISEVAKAAKLLSGIGYIVIFLAIAAVVVAVFFGAGRVVIRRLQGKPASSVTDDEYITLKL